MSDYAYWSAALDGKFGPVHDGDPQPGFYRKRIRQGGSFAPVAIWQSGGPGGKMIAVVDGKEADAAAIWTFVCQNPITEAAYHRAADGGGGADEPPAPKLSNLPSNPCEALAIEFAAEREIAEEFLKQPVTTKDQADQVAVLTKRLSTIKGKATDLHKVEKQPHLDAGRGVDEKWRTLKEEPDELSKKLKRHLDAYLQEQDRKERERQRLARDEADRKQQAADEAARAAATSGSDEAGKIAERKREEATQAEHDAQARNAAAGRTGAKVALRTFVSATITDFPALLLALKDRPEIQEVVKTLANRAAKSGVALPGMTITEERRAA